MSSNSSSLPVATSMATVCMVLARIWAKTPMAVYVTGLCAEATTPGPLCRRKNRWVGMSVMPRGLHRQRPRARGSQFRIHRAPSARMRRSALLRSRGRADRAGALIEWGRGRIDLVRWRLQAERIDVWALRRSWHFNRQPAQRAGDSDSVVVATGRQRATPARRRRRARRGRAR